MAKFLRELGAFRGSRKRRAAPMQDNGIRLDQVTQVRGFADQRLRKPAAPLDPSNRRISMIAQYLAKAPPQEIHAPADAQDEKGSEGKVGEGKPSEAKPTEAKPTKKE
jgi:chemotaxis protein MotB